MPIFLFQSYERKGFADCIQCIMNTLCNIDTNVNNVRYAISIQMRIMIMISGNDVRRVLKEFIGIRS